MTNAETGKTAENIATAFLIVKGYKIIARNFRPPRGSGAGEIDIIAEKKQTLVFIEVKARGDFASAAEAITPQQQQRIFNGAEAFIAFNPKFANHALRFDAILFDGKIPKHLQDAFRP